ncbi:hypothetical protein OHA10_20335 [Kribbella sp. NBC_00662]|uniref:hypothetical protein n=1 Tax=Kribbella sp. NBC_00662 TaxID=2975969 RepID=UPI003249460B
MSNSMAAGARVAAAIGVIKWVLIGLALVVAGVAVLLAVVDGTDYDLAMAVGTVVGSVIWILLVWVLFGWFEHTLSALIVIARNTTQQAPGTYDVPPAPYERQA